MTPRRGMFLLGLVAICGLAIVVVPRLLSRPAAGPYVPEVAGVVAATEAVDEGQTRFHLGNGQLFTAKIFDSTAATLLYGTGPRAGELLLAGSGPVRPWLALLPAPEPFAAVGADCYRLDDNGTDEGDWIQTDLGLRLRKTPDFDPGLLPLTPGGPIPTAHPGLRYDGAQRTFCLNSEGHVIARR